MSERDPLIQSLNVAPYRREKLFRMFAPVMLGMTMFITFSTIAIFLRWHLAGDYACTNIVGGGKSEICTFVQLGGYVLLSLYVWWVLRDSTFDCIEDLATPDTGDTWFVWIFGNLKLGLEADIPTLPREPYTVMDSAEKGVIMMFFALIVSSYVTLLHIQHTGSEISVNILGNEFILQFILNVLGYFCEIGLLYKFTRLLHYVPHDRFGDTAQPVAVLIILHTILVGSLIATQLAIKLKCAMETDADSFVDPVSRVLLIVTSLFEELLNFLMYDMIVIGRNYRRGAVATPLLTSIFDWVMGLFKQEWRNRSIIMYIFYFFTMVIFVAKTTYATSDMMTVNNAAVAGGLLNAAQLLVGLIASYFLISSYPQEDLRPNDPLQETWTLIGETYYWQPHNLFKSLMLVVFSFGGLLACYIYRSINDHALILSIFANIFVYLPMFLSFPTKAFSKDGLIWICHGLFSALVLIENLYHIGAISTTNLSQWDTAIFVSQIFECLLCFKLFSMLVWQQEWH